MHIAEAHSKQYLKCSLCPSAFVDKKKLSEHGSEKHENNGNITMNNLYKIKIKTKTFFCTNKTSMIEQLKKNIELPSIFVFTCTCDEKYFTAETLSSHLDNSQNCSGTMSHPSLKLFPEDPDEDRCYTGVMDDLRYLQHEQRWHYQNHQSRHHRRLHNILW